MNQQKIKYAENRIDAIFKKQQNALLDKYTTKGITLTSKERCTLLKQGKIKVRPEITHVNAYTDVVDVFDFSNFEKASTVNHKQYDKAMAKLERDKNTILDELMLGDGEQALKLISKLEGKTYV